ncbi:MAG: diguanylate cyclase [Terracidiphilus sp.]|jgi:diguanylate cyclase (GGDEF)-like protein
MSNLSQPIPTIRLSAASLRWHFFLAHSDADSDFALKLYRHLAKTHRTFLSSESLSPGDAWPVEIPAAQRNSLITVIIVSPATEPAYYQREEIAAAIEQSRLSEIQRRVIPVFLFPKYPKEVPYGLRQIHSIVGISSVKEIADKLRKAVASVLQSSPEIRPLDEVLVDSNEPDQIAYLSRVTNTELDGSIVSAPSLMKERGHTFLTDEMEANVEKWANVYKTMSLLLIDIDKLTGINNRYGSIVGDEVLQSIIKILSGYATEDFGRCGDDTFFVILFDCSREVVEMLANQMLEEIQRNPWDRLASDLFVTCSIGMADLKRFNPIRDWPVRAAQGMNQAKRGGGNQIAYGPDYLRQTASRNLRDYYS